MQVEYFLALDKSIMVLTEDIIYADHVKSLKCIIFH